jgi:hypothetical protein
VLSAHKAERAAASATLGLTMEQDPLLLRAARGEKVLFKSRRKISPNVAEYGAGPPASARCARRKVGSTCVCMCVCVCVCVCVCACVFVYVYTYIHAFIDSAARGEKVEYI